VFFSVLALVLCLIPMLVPSIPTMDDLPQHVLVARVIVEYGNRALGYAHYFDPRWHLAPGTLFYALLAGLQFISRPYLDAKLYLILWVLTLWASVYLLARVRGQAHPWIPAIVTLPLAFSWYVYMGFLPFLMTMPLFVMILAVWCARIGPTPKICLVALLLWMSFLFHVVGAAAAAATICIVAAIEVLAESARRAPLWMAAAAVSPLLLIVLPYLFGQSGPTVHIVWTNPISNLLACVRYNVISLDVRTAGLMFAWFVLLGGALLLQRNHLRVEAPLLLAALGLLVLACAIPADLGSLWPAGPRLVPFALLLLISAVPWQGATGKPTVVLALMLLLGMSVTTTLKVLSLKPDYDEFLSALPVVSEGSKVLPVIVDPAEKRKWVAPFLSLASAYTIDRGGASPYAFASPHVKTGASPLTYLDSSVVGKYAFFYQHDVPPEAYRGVSQVYDYVLVWGTEPALQRVLEQELTIVHRQGRLTIYATSKSSRATRHLSDPESGAAVPLE
jgi:hypothetical protein